MKIKKIICDCCGKEILGDLDLKKIFGNSVSFCSYKKEPHITINIGDTICPKEIQHVLTDRDICQDCFEKLCKFLNLIKEDDCK